MASRYVQEIMHGTVHNDAPEGTIKYLDIGESVTDLVARYAGALRSGISYSGGSSIETFQTSVNWVRI